MSQARVTTHVIDCNLLGSLPDDGVPALMERLHGLCGADVRLQRDVTCLTRRLRCA